MEFLLQIGLVILLVLLNGYFVASEFALVAIRKTKVDELVRKGNGRAKHVQGVLKHLDMYISSTQLGITIASLALGWVGEPAIAHAIEPMLSFFPETAAVLTSHSVAVIIAFTLITFMHIILGEVVPKSIALQRSEATAMVIVMPLIIFTKLFSPFIWVLNSIGRLILNALGFRAPSGHSLVHSEEEIKMLLTQSSKQGLIPAKEVQMVYNVFQLGDIPVKLIMVPRTSIIALNVSMTLRDIVERVSHYPHSRFPIYEHSLDNIIGFVHLKDVYRELLKKGESVRLSQLHITRSIIHIPEVKKIDTTLQEMRRKRIHLAVVVDEFGGTAGIITLEDIIESVVGEIEDEFDDPMKDIVRNTDGSYIIQGHTLIQAVQQIVPLPLRGQGYTTIGGLVFGLLGHEPRVGDTVQIGDLVLKVEEIEGKRVKNLLLKKEKKRKMQKRSSHL